MTIENSANQILTQLVGPYAIILVLLLIAIVAIGMFVLRFTPPESIMVAIILCFGIASLNINPMFESLKLVAYVGSGFIIAFFFWTHIINQ